MNNYEATELAYKNGYAKGRKERQMKKFIAFILGMLYQLMAGYGFFWLYLVIICNITQVPTNGFVEVIIAIIAAVASESGIYFAIMKRG